jgi:toxin ParE1/3/4
MNSKSRYRLSKRAAETLGDIFNHTLHHFGLAKARDYAKSLLNTFDIIAENPELGRLHSDLSPPARVHPHREHVLLYILDEDGYPLITQIYNARQNWKHRHSTTPTD